MSIYFVHLFIEVFVLSFFCAYSAKNYNILPSLIASALGFIFAYIIYFIFSYEKQIRYLELSANCILIIALFLFLFAKNNLFKSICLFLLSLSLFMRYYFKSDGFLIFESSLLDTLGVINCAYILLALCIALVFFACFYNAFKYLKNTFLIRLLITILYINIALSSVCLFMYKRDLLGFFDEVFHDGALLSYISRSHYFYEFYPYLLLFLGLVFCALSLKQRSNHIEKLCDFDIEYRKAIYKNHKINTFFSVYFIIALSAICVNLFYDLVDSKPISIDEAKVITPNTKDYFTFNLQEVSDGKLHRYAYISASGRKIRFFIINKFKGKVTPVAVFDYCNICGDLGYVLRNDELLCVACNVRIFLPSVGKNGGCNPQPLEYEIDEENNLFKIKIRNIKNGENYFSEIVEVKVIDPVSKKEFLNIEAKRTYQYNGINYYFESDESFNEFKKNPDKYVEQDAKAPYLIQYLQG